MQNKVKRLSFLLIFLGSCAKKENVNLAPGYTTDKLTALVQDFESDFQVCVEFEVAFVDTFSQE